MAKVLEHVQIELSINFKIGAMANTKFLYKSDHTGNEQQYNSKQQQHNTGNVV